jgi:hypothetical protein
VAILPGKRLGPYEILSGIGAGGMGEVYRARDTRLDRIVPSRSFPITMPVTQNCASDLNEKRGQSPA